MVLFWIASLGFFLLLIRQLFRWMHLWQISDYNLHDFIQAFLLSFRKEKEFVFFLFVFIISCVFYGFVIFNDSLTTMFQFYTTIIFILGGMLFLWEGLNKKITKPIFTSFSITLAALTLFIVSLLYMLPFLDAFAWILILIALVPIIISIFVGLFSFPREIYSDIILQKARTKLDTHNSKVILFIGDKKSEITGQYIKKLISPEQQVIHIPQNQSILSVAKRILPYCNGKTKFFIIHFSSKSKELTQKMCAVFQPSVFIYLSIPENYKTKREKVAFLKMQKLLIETLPKDCVVFINGEDQVLFHFAQTLSHVVFLFGMKENFHKKDIFLLSEIMKKRKNTAQICVTMGKKKRVYIIHSRVKDISLLLPAIFLAKIWGVSEKNIEDRLYDLKPQ